jgi:hypothetical protein
MIQYPNAQVVGEQPGFLSTGSSGNVLADLVVMQAASTVAHGSHLPLMSKYPKTHWAPSSYQWGPWGRQHLPTKSAWKSLTEQGGFWKSQLGKALGVPAAADAAEAAALRGATVGTGAKLGAWGTAGIIGAGVSSFVNASILNVIPQLIGGGIEAFAGLGVQARRERKQRTYLGGLEMWGRGFFDTQAAATMRQSSLALIQESQLGVRSALSREAFFMHR